MSDEQDAADQEAGERIVARRLRAVTMMVIVMAIATAIAACLPGGFVITDARYVDHTTAAGGVRLAVRMLILALPGIAVLRRPRWTPIVCWIVWGILCMFSALSYLLRVYGDNEFIGPRWPAWVMGGLFCATLLGLGCALPTIRGSHRSPRSHSATGLPGARVLHR